MARIAITEDHVGGFATHTDAKQMVALLRARGYDVQYGTDGEPPTDEAIPQSVWEECIEAIGEQAE